MPPAKRPLSGNQETILRTLGRMLAAGRDVVKAREVAAELNSGTDGPAYTLRSLVSRGLVGNGHFSNDMYGYKLTAAGIAWLAEHP